MLEISPTMSKLMGANSVENGEIASLPLGDMGRENGKIFIEGSYEGETTRMLLFSEAQAKKMGIDLNKPAFVAIEDGYNIVDVHKYGYAIDVPEIALPNLRIYYGSFYNGALRHVDGEFSIPVKEIAQAFDAETTRYFYYFKPGPAVREYSGDPSDNFRVSFGPVDRLLWHGRFGVLSDES
ncbi:hypothetical protein COU37_04115 [Candidatus Micrarchaeota archaeon CG10_big_fil_rev_8_21_14_0_10_45_29]|nr:MAG: hypothetical protein COU37_04115 [Candidatus Micrarchaeota archaeon CG10_big_fil_rev_8_21_14_0_10_45_29]